MESTYKILVVDDEPDVEPLVLQRMRRSIRAGKYSFVFAQNGVEAVEVLKADRDIDMVLSDINMPQMDGLTLLEQVGKIDPNIRSVIISAYGDMKNIRTAMNRGAFDFVTKPIDFKDLQVTMDRTLKHMEEWKEALEARDRLVSIQNELEVASRMQQSILPTEFPKGSGFRLSASMLPARSVGGDFFDVMQLENGRIGVAVADVSDKGVPAALFMMSSRTLLKGAAIGARDPAAVLKEVNDLLCKENDALMFVTLLYGVYDPSNGNFTYANGGHNAPLIVHPDGSSDLLPLTGGVALALAPGMDYEQDTVTLEPGDAAFLYTDGVTEAMNVEEEEFGIERLQDIFSKSPPTDAHETNEAIHQAVNDFAGEAEQSDDVTCLTLLRTRAQS